MHFQHVLFRSFSWITKNALKHHCHITHQVHRVIVHNDIPWHFDLLFGCFLLFNRRRFQCRAGEIDYQRGGEFCLVFSEQPAHGKGYHAALFLQTICSHFAVQSDAVAHRAMATIRE